MKVRTRARVYYVIGVNLFHGKTMRFHLIKRSFHIYYTTCVRTCSRSFLQGPSHDFIHTAFNRFVLSHFFSQSTLIYDSVCAFCRNNLFSFSILSAVLWKIRAHFPQMLLMHMFNIQSGPVKSTIFKERNVTSQLLEFRGALYVTLFVIGFLKTSPHVNQGLSQPFINGFLFWIEQNPIFRLYICIQFVHFCFLNISVIYVMRLTVVVTVIN